MKVLQPQGWPRPKGYANGIAARGELRHQFCHASDLVPTLLDDPSGLDHQDLVGADAEVAIGDRAGQGGGEGRWRLHGFDEMVKIRSAKQHGGFAVQEAFQTGGGIDRNSHGRRCQNVMHIGRGGYRRKAFSADLFDNL